MCPLRPHQTHIPTEILDEIIDNLATSHSDSKPLVLSNIALTSRGCRHRVNHHRFSILEIYIHTTPSDRLENLAHLLCCNLWEQQEVIALHIRSVCLMLGRRDHKVPLHSEFRDRVIANILNTVFKRSGDQPPRSMTICTARHCHYPHNGPSNGLYSITGLSFDTLGSETIAALHDSRCNQSFMTLRLEKIWNVPSSLFSTSAIKNLYINHAHFTASKIPDHPGLVNLEVQEASSFVPVCYCGLQGGHVEPIAQVKYWLRDQEEYGGLTKIGKYATALQVIVHEYLDVPFSTVDYIQSNLLQCLRIQREYHQSYLYWYSEHNQPPVLDESFQPFFLGMLHLLPSVPPPILDLKIQVFHKYHYLQDNICDGIDDIYSRIYHLSLVQWLKNKCSLTGTQATITLDIRFDFYVANDYDPSIFHGTCESYMRKLLAPLGIIEGVKLIIKVSGD